MKEPPASNRPGPRQRAAASSGASGAGLVGSPALAAQRVRIDAAFGHHALAQDPATAAAHSAGTGTTGPVAQRYSESPLTPAYHSPIQQALFRQRVTDSKAVSGQHNYAIDLSNWNIARSSSNKHAEIALLLKHAVTPGEEIIIVSEYQPCGHCNADLREFEQTHGVTIRVHYLMPYSGSGDGDAKKTVAWYLQLGMLVSPGPQYVPHIAPDFS